MKLLELIVRKKQEYRNIKEDLSQDMRTASKLQFLAEFNKLEKDRNNIIEILGLLEELAVACQKERVFTETEISHLQSEIYKITGEGEVMGLFNKMLGINAG
jgi:hypothetical protein